MVPDDLHLDLKVHCAKCQTTLNDYFLEALKLYMQHECTRIFMIAAKTQRPSISHVIHDKHLACEKNGERVLSTKGV